jgi:hypothetical protein
MAFPHLLGASLARFPPVTTYLQRYLRRIFIHPNGR